MTVDLDVIVELAHSALNRPTRRGVLISEREAAQMATDVCALAEEVRYLATSLLEIAELAMPDTYFQTDSRCQAARAVLSREPAEEDR